MEGFKSGNDGGRLRGASRFFQWTWLRDEEPRVFVLPIEVTITLLIAVDYRV
jgi:hypothetical protein